MSSWVDNLYFTGRTVASCQTVVSLFSQELFNWGLTIKDGSVLFLQANGGSHPSDGTGTVVVRFPCLGVSLDDDGSANSAQSLMMRRLQCMFFYHRQERAFFPLVR